MRKLDVIVREITVEDGKLSLDFPGETIANIARERFAYSMLEKHPNSKLYFLSWDDEYAVPVGAKVGDYEVEGQHMGLLHDKDGTQFGSFDHLPKTSPKSWHEMVVATLS